MTRTLSPPEALIIERIAAFRRDDFSFIFDSYLSEAPFRNFFPDRAEYLTYAAEQIRGAFRIADYKIFRCEIQGAHAELLLLQVIEYRGERREVLEVCRLEQTDSGDWRYHSGLKLDSNLLPADLHSLGWDQLEAAGDGVWI